MHEGALHRARIVSSVAATAISLACGTNYVYSAWAPQFADKLQLTATQSNLIGLSGNLGMYSLGVPVGIFIDTRGPRPAVLSGSLLLGLGYFLLRQAFVAGSGSLVAMCIYAYLTGLGGSMAFSSAIKTSALNWPHHRGTATAVPLAAFGLSAFFFSVVGSVAFPGDTGAFLLLLAVGTFGLTTTGFFFLRVWPHASVHGHAYDALPDGETPAADGAAGGLPRRKGLSARARATHTEEPGTLFSGGDENEDAEYHSGLGSGGGFQHADGRGYSEEAADGVTGRKTGAGKAVGTVAGTAVAAGKGAGSAVGVTTTYPASPLGSPGGYLSTADSETTIAVPAHVSASGSASASASNSASNSASGPSSVPAFPQDADQLSMDETSSLMSRTSSLPGDVLVQNSVDMDRSHRIDIRGWALMASAEFWQLFSIMGILAGIGLMTINNIGHDANALWKHYDDSVSESFLVHRQQMHVSILSIGSFTGRLLSGTGSDFLVKRLQASRVWCLVFASVVFSIAQVLALTIVNPHYLAFVSSLSGVGYGFLMGVFPSIVAESFGIHGLSQNWGFMTMAPTISGNIFNIFYGTIFDHHSIVGPDGERTCPDGLLCYRAAYLVTLCACGLGLVVTLLVIRHQHLQRLREMGKRSLED